MNDQPSADDRVRALQELSALADGEVDAAGVAAVCDGWRADAQLRASWHAYHLIGDAMRSDELAADAAGDAAFVLALRERLAREPVVLAPATARDAPAPARARAGWSWKAPAAVAAGFMAVAAALLVTNGTPSLPGGAGQSTLAQSPRDGTAPAAAFVQGAAPGAEPQVLVADGQLVRDARLQRYLAAHNQFSGSSALGAPSGFLRAATSQTPPR